MNLVYEKNLKQLEEELISIWCKDLFEKSLHYWIIYESDIATILDDNILSYNLWQNLNTITYKIQQSCLVLNISYIPIEKECKYNRSSRIKEVNLYWTKEKNLNKLSNLRLYLNEVSKIPVISIEEERKISSLAKKWDEKAWKLLILKMQRSVINAAKSFPLWNLWLFDLIQEWNIWLIKAIENFDPNIWTPFSLYASWWIRQNMSNAIADMKYVCNLPIHVIDEINNYNKVYSDLFESLWKDPIRKEIRQRLWYPINKVERIESIIHGDISLDRKILNYSWYISADLIEDKKILHPDQIAEKNILKENIHQILWILDDKESKIVKMKFWIDWPTYSFEQIWEEFECSRSYVGHVINNVIKKFKEHLWFQKMLWLEDEIEKMEDENIRKKRARKSKKIIQKKKIEDDDDEFDFAGRDDDSEDYFPTDAEDDDFDIEVWE